MRKKLLRPLSAVKGKDAERQQRVILLNAAGVDYSRDTDPVAALSDSYRKTFDLNLSPEEESGRGGIDSAKPERGSEGGLTRAGEFNSLRRASDMRDIFEQRDEDGKFRRFRETAAHGGKMSGAVAAGRGEIMLHSCLNRSGAGVASADGEKRRRLFERGSSRNLTVHPDDRVMFNRGVQNSALSLVISAERSARELLSELKDLSVGGVLPKGTGGETLRRMYPFLDSSAEKEQLELLRARLAETGDGEGGAISRAITKTKAVIERKESQRERFLHEIESLKEKGQRFCAYLEERLSAAQQPEGDGAVSPAEPPGPPPDSEDPDSDSDSDSVSDSPADANTSADADSNAEEQ